MIKTNHSQMTWTEAITAASSVDSRRCSAGRSFFIIISNGTVYRCWFHRLDPCGSVSKLELNPLADSRCHDRRCIPTCEPREITIWEPGQEPEVGEFTHVKSDNPLQPQTEFASFHVTFNRACNYACPYCIAGSQNIKMVNDKENWLPPEHWLRWWHWVKETKQGGSVVISGGEPTIFPRFDEIALKISELPGYHRLCTNLSMPKAMGPFIEGAINNFVIFAALHPNSPNFNFERFAETAQRIQGKCPIEISIVDTPVNAEFVKPYQEYFESRGFKFWTHIDMLAKRQENLASMNAEKEDRGIITEWVET